MEELLEALSEFLLESGFRYGLHNVSNPHNLDALRQAIRQHKAALLAMLTPERRIPLPRYPAPCWRCKGPSERQGLRYLLCPPCQAETGEH